MEYREKLAKAIYDTHPLIQYRQGPGKDIPMTWEMLKDSHRDFYLEAADVAIKYIKENPDV